VTPDRKKPGRFTDDRPEPDDQMVGSEGGVPDDPTFREPRPADPREEVRKRASRYTMEDPEEASRRRREAREAPVRSGSYESRGGRGDDRDEPDERGEQGLGSESRPHSNEPIPEERDEPEIPREPGDDQEDDAWSRIDRDS
jgi:hypothetical protein